MNCTAQHLETRCLQCGLLTEVLLQGPQQVLNSIFAVNFVKTANISGRMYIKAWPGYECENSKSITVKDLYIECTQPIINYSCSFMARYRNRERSVEHGVKK